MSGCSEILYNRYSFALSVDYGYGIPDVNLFFRRDFRIIIECCLKHAVFVCSNLPLYYPKFYFIQFNEPTDGRLKSFYLCLRNSNVLRKRRREAVCRFSCFYLHFINLQIHAAIISLTRKAKRPPGSAAFYALLYVVGQIAISFFLLSHGRRNRRD